MSKTANSSTDLKAIDYYLKEHDETKKEYEESKKLRKKREILLLTTCLFAFLYSYPVNDFNNNPEISIPAISLKISLRDAILLFPTIITVIYLSYSSAVMNSMTLLAETISKMLRVQAHIGDADDSYKTNYVYMNTTAGYSLRNFMVPSNIQIRANTRDKSPWFKITKHAIEFFVSLLFNLLPFAVSLFLVNKAFSLNSNYFLLVWNIFCILLMLLSFISILQIRSRQKNDS